MNFTISESNVDFIDESEHSGMGAYYEILERYQSGRSGVEQTELALRDLIEGDPDFFDPYLLLADIAAKHTDGMEEAITLRRIAFERAMDLLQDDKGEYPQKVEWGWLENRHILRAILQWADFCWASGQPGDAADLFRFLLCVCPADNQGARYYLLAILKGIEYKFFHSRYQVIATREWFDNGASKYPKEFSAFYEELRRFEED